MKTTIRLIAAGLALAPFASSPALSGTCSPILALATPAAPGKEITVDDLKTQIVELRAEVEKLKAAREAKTDDDEEAPKVGTPSDLAPLHIYGTVECDFDKLAGLSEAQRRELKDWRLLRLGEWNAAARLAAAEHDDVEQTDSGTAHWTINLHWTLVRKAGGVTAVCCHVAEDTCGPYPINSVYAFNFTGDTAAVVTPRKLFANAEALAKLRELIANHRDEATDRCFGDYDAKWEKKHEGDGGSTDSDDEQSEPAQAVNESADTDDAPADAQASEMTDAKDDEPAPADDNDDDDDDADSDKFAIDWYKLTQIAITEDSLLFCFDQGAIGPMREGALVIPVPIDELRELLSPEGRALFPKR